LALARRAWYERPGARLRLARPVVSVGNLSVGGTGKSPFVAALAAWLVAEGERPAILSRGYARPVAAPGVTVVSDGTRVLADARHAGDEPMMLAQAVPGAAVVVAADRYQAGLMAERELGATVHLLDDGFQHLPLARDLDIVVTPVGELAREHVLPKGRLREPLSALTRASLLVVVGATDDEAIAEARAVGVAVVVGAVRRQGAPVAVQGGVPAPGAVVVALAGIGQPAQFVAGLSAAGWQVADTCLHPDHHWYSPADLAAAARAVEAAGAWGVLTTDKDAVRLDLTAPLPCRVARVPLTLDVPRWDVVAAAVRQALRVRA
ncbi:MAG TPA: tetraacyldisaccharide 4'-kinase, partial [Vicinamibacterales bacterium]|nr:tetraacyldisaccharide 4'-kinase [Vicinamibacterales bacterium]